VNEDGPPQGPTKLVGSTKAGRLAATDPSRLAIGDLRAWSVDQKSHMA
jgi:hypothetical protein